MADWRSTYSERFLQRAIQRPEAEPVYVRPTDGQIALLPEAVQPLVKMQRNLFDTMAPIAAALARMGLRSNDELAKREWPHVPFPLARAYAAEYVRTGRRP